MMSEYTEGNWGIEESFKAPEIDYVAYIKSENGKEIGGITNFETSIEETKANAQLIATAPELLEAAEYSLEIVKTLDCHCDSYNGFTCKKHEWKRKLERVIKKAKGELNDNNN